ncbi:MAG: beta-galactosidase trimerization domain-containing protein [Phycisphaerae bacterium]|jgi:hypothetical protein|nr:beta-galactosidase trimerization domain-containing protein [Phycisphaerae bacterium]
MIRTVRIAMCVLVSLGCVTASAAPKKAPAAPKPAVVVAEGERFRPADDKGWKVTHQEQSYGSHIYGGMWSTFGGLLGAPADSVGSVARRSVVVPKDGAFRVWSKYQAPPYYNYEHRVEIFQNGKKVFSGDYGKASSPKLWSFSGAYRLKPIAQTWWPWGLDHDCAQAPIKPVELKSGPAEIRLTTLASAKPAGDRYVDFILLTTDHRDTCDGFQKHGQAKSPFMFEALDAAPIFMRFKNNSGVAAKIDLHTNFGHHTWHCGPAKGAFPDLPVAAGQWSPWFNINRVVRLVTDEGLRVSISGAGKIPVEVALDAGGQQVLGRLEVPNGESINFPMEITWDKTKRLRLSRDIAEELIVASKTKWRKACSHKPKHIAFFGSFSRGKVPWAMRLKDALGYNTQLPDKYEHLDIDGYHQHVRNPAAIRKHAESLGAKRTRHRVASFGDEIHIGDINFKDPKYAPMFRKWLEARGLGAEDLGGVSPDLANFNANPRLTWYSKIFSAQQRFGHYRDMTQIARRAYGPQVLTGANFSPHHGVAYYGSNLQWIDAFKHNAMSMFWTEDYIFSMGEPPQIFSFLFARAHCAVKYNSQPIHMYVMPHAPAQTARSFRRNMIYAIGAGAKHIDNFWVAPQEQYSENYVSWGYTDTFQAIFESIYDTAAVEEFLTDSRRRPARVALITGKAAQINEDNTRVDPKLDPFASRCANAPAKLTQNICRKDQQALYLALRHAQVRVDLITEDDIVADDALKSYDVVYFAAQWINNKAVGKLDAWVKAGGVLYASSGLGLRNQFNEPSDAMSKLLGIGKVKTIKTLYRVRPMIELPLARPAGRIEMGPRKMDAIGMKQNITPTVAEVLGKWSGGKAAVTVREYGKGKAFAVGTLPGLSYLKTGLRVAPAARGGAAHIYNPVGFDSTAAELVRLGLAAADVKPHAACDNPHVEALVRDNKTGALLTLVNWTNDPKVTVKVALRLSYRPGAVKSVTLGKAVKSDYRNGMLYLDATVTQADFITIRK